MSEYRIDMWETFSFLSYNYFQVESLELPHLACQGVQILFILKFLFNFQGVT